jgi:hypothetical protein
VFSLNLLSGFTSSHGFKDLNNLSVLSSLYLYNLSRPRSRSPYLYNSNNSCTVGIEFAFSPNAVQRSLLSNIFRLARSFYVSFNSNSTNYRGGASSNTGATSQRDVLFYYTHIHTSIYNSQYRLPDRYLYPLHENFDYSYSKPSLFSLYPPFDYQSYNSAPAAIMPLIASRIDLPEEKQFIDMLEVLPPSLSILYSKPNNDLLVTPSIHSPRQPRSRLSSDKEYVKLVKKLYTVGMVDFTQSPKCVNSLFSVSKDDNKDRLIIDARLANTYFIPSPPVQLPSPTSFTYLHFPHSDKVFIAKLDISNFYHRLKLPIWLSDYFCLLPVRRADIFSHTQSEEIIYPRCRTLPMGWSHSVFIAQMIHLNLLYNPRFTSLPSLYHPYHNILNIHNGTLSPFITRNIVIHIVYIDDLILISLNSDLIDVLFNYAIRCYSCVNLIVKLSKSLRATTGDVDALGLVINGTSGVLTVSGKKRLSILHSTIRFIKSCRSISGYQLASLIGEYTWLMLVRRPALSSIRFCYYYIDKYKNTSSHLWTSVRHELSQLACLLPLLNVNLRDPNHYYAYSSDASMSGAGIVRKVLSEKIFIHIIVNNKSGLSDSSSSSSLLDDKFIPYFYNFSHQNRKISTLNQHHWSTIIAHKWRFKEHINLLEARAALLTLLSSLRARKNPFLSTRILLCIDNQVLYYALKKGRCSSPNLLLIIKKISSLLLSSSITLYPIWIPSELNPADRASRLYS